MNKLLKHEKFKALCLIYEWIGYFKYAWSMTTVSSFSWLGFSLLFDLKATAFHHWHVTSVQVVMNCCMLAQSVSDCLQAACSRFLSFLQVQTICDVNSACSTISAIAIFTQIRKWNKGLVAHLLPFSTQVWNMLHFMSPIHLCGITDL